MAMPHRARRHARQRAVNSPRERVRAPRPNHRFLIVRIRPRARLNSSVETASSFRWRFAPVAPDGMKAVSSLPESRCPIGTVRHEPLSGGQLVMPCVYRSRNCGSRQRVTCEGVGRSGLTSTTVGRSLHDELS
jgi:hypothetical protein